MNPDNEFSIIEKRDEAQILAELEGQVIEEYFYVTSKKKAVISYMGIKEIARIRKNIKTSLVEIKETDSSWIVVIEAMDKNINLSLLGTSVQAKLEKVYQYLGSGNDRRRAVDENKQFIFALEPDDFCYQKAFSKAQRNAIKAIVPEAVFTKALEEWKSQRKGGSSTKNVEPQPRRKAEAEFKIVDFLKKKELKAPEWGLKDELNRSPEAWGDAKNITEAWLDETGFNPDVFEVMVNKTRIAIKPKKAFPLDVRTKVSDILAEAGFVQTKNLWRLQKKDVQG